MEHPEKYEEILEFCGPLWNSLSLSFQCFRRLFGWRKEKAEKTVKMVVLLGEGLGRHTKTLKKNQDCFWFGAQNQKERPFVSKDLFLKVEILSSSFLCSYFNLCLNI